MAFVYCRMQFSHVSDMTSEEILDYAVLYANETSDLNIKSFNNMEVRDYIQDDWISIFIDLMVDILSIENPLVLRTHATTKGENFLFAGCLIYLILIKYLQIFSSLWINYYLRVQPLN